MTPKLCVFRLLLDSVHIIKLQNYQLSDHHGWEAYHYFCGIISHMVSALLDIFRLFNQ